MENETIKIITSERGKDLALVGTDKYRFIRQRKDGQVKWLCTNRTCYTSICQSVAVQKYCQCWVSTDIF